MSYPSVSRDQISEASPSDSLHDTTWSYVFKWLAAPDKRLVRLVCRRFRKVLDESQLELRRRVSSHVSVESLHFTFPNVTSLKLSGFWDVGDVEIGGALHGLPKLKNLELLGCFIAGEQTAERLCMLSKLQQLTVNYVQKSDNKAVMCNSIVRAISKMTSLSKLTFLKKGITEAEITVLSSLTNLTHFYLSIEQPTDNAFEPLKHLCKLSTLELTMTGRRNPQFVYATSSLACLTQLSSLLLDKWFLEDDTLSAIARLTALGHLHLTNTSDVVHTSLIKLSTLSNLQAFSMTYQNDLAPLQQEQFSEAVLELMPLWPKLSVLTLLTDLDQLLLCGQLQRLSSLELILAQSREIFWEDRPLHRLTNLTSLRLCQYSITEECLQQLSSLSRLNNLVLDSCWGLRGSGNMTWSIPTLLTSVSFVKCDDLNDLLLASLNPASQLKSLKFVDCPDVTVQGILSIFRVCSSLTSLHLEHLERFMNMEDLKHNWPDLLLEMRSLSHLYLVNSSAGIIREFADLKFLQHLDLRSCWPVCDNHLLTLTGCTRLQHLVLGSCPQAIHTASFSGEGILTLRCLPNLQVVCLVGPCPKVRSEDCGFVMASSGITLQHFKDPSDHTMLKELVLY